MRFKIIVVGWNCADYILWTLESIEAQGVSNYDVMIVDDATEDPQQAEIIRSWCDARDDRWRYRINPDHLGPVRNQYEAILALDPSDADVIVWLDLDGDRFAHPDVLAHVAEAYADGQTMLTYGSYRPVPDMGTHAVATPFPLKVVRDNSYRWHVIKVGTCFNHLRTMRGDVFRSIPIDQFHWPDGRWYEAATDYIFMVAGLERAGGHYKFLDEVLLIYNHSNPWSRDPAYHAETARCNINFHRRPPLKPLNPVMVIKPQSARLPMSHRPEDWTEEWLPQLARRELLREMAGIYDLRIFIETGTLLGETPWALKEDFTELHTIELSEHLFHRAVERFRHHGQVNCWFGDSAEVLPKVLASVQGPALIWLDGHYSGGSTARGSMDSPIRAELEVIFATGESHVILIDDARCFKGGSEHEVEEHYADYPSISWVREQAEANGFGFVLEDDIMRITPW